MKINPVITGSMIVALAAAAWPGTGATQDLRRVFKHRDIWVENIGACPTDMTDRIIDLFLAQGREIRTINVNPNNPEPPGDCRAQSVFLVYLAPDDLAYTYPGYQRMIERSGEFQPHSWGEPADLPFMLDDPRLRVIEFDRGAMYLTTLNTHRVRLGAGTQLTGRQTDAIVRAVHKRYRPDIDRPIKSDFVIESKDPGRVTVTFTDDRDKQRTYDVQKTGTDWAVRPTEKDSTGGQRPLGGSR